MRRRIRLVAVAICATAFAAPAAAQSTTPAFELADVRLSPRSISTATRNPTFRAGRYEGRRVTLLSLISTAYGVPAAAIVGGPNWLDYERYDIVAAAPATTSAQTVREMLQSLLTARWSLKVHPDTIPQPQYALRVGKDGHRLKRSDGTERATCGSLPVPQTVAQQVVCRNTTMATLAARVRQLAGSYFSAPVVDATGLSGEWDFDFTVWPASAQAAAGDGDTIFTAMRKLGLELVRDDTPTPVLIVDGANRQPAANPPGVEKFAASPVKFEVASVRPVAAGGNAVRGSNVQPGGQVNLRGMTVRDLIAFGWDTNNERVFGPTASLDGQRFDVTAAVPADVPRPIDAQMVRPMVQALLADRFTLVAHEEEREVDVYALVPPPRPSDLKMKRGNESERGSCTSTPSLIPPNSGLSAAVVCTNVSMTNYAYDLPGWAPAYIDLPVVDITALDGVWNFTFMWTGLSQTNGRVNARQPGDRQEALAPVGTLTVFEAIERQLGVKLTRQKHALPVLIVDRLEPNPTEN